MNWTLYKEPDIEDDNPTLKSITDAIDSIDPDQRDPTFTLFPEPDIDGTNHLQFQYVKDCDTGEVSMCLSTFVESEGETRYYDYHPESMEELKEIVYNYFVNHKLTPELQYWNDSTEYIIVPNSIHDFEIFKEAFKTVRKSGKEIYKGFGFKHLSNVTQYYVHPNNNSETGTTSLCQPIGEAMVLFLTMLSDIEKKGSSSIGDFYYSKEKDIYYFEIIIPEELRNAKIVDKSLFSYKAMLDQEYLCVCAYNKEGEWIEKNELLPYTELYKFLPAFMVLIAREIENNDEFSVLAHNFTESPAADIFVNLNEDFYQNNKTKAFTFQYSTMGYIQKDKLKSFSSKYKTIIENKNRLNEILSSAVYSFNSTMFPVEFQELIPDLPSEFKLQKELIPLCNSIQNNDTLSVLFHGPAGTGKTIACKKVCQAIRIPIMETVNCTENLDEFILGKYIPQGSEFIFLESYVTKAVRFGGAVVFEEINFAKPQYLAFLNSLLDDNGFIRLDSGEIVKRHKNFRFFATMNIGYFGTKELNQALFNRFNAVVELPALPDDAIRLMLESRVPACEPYIDKMLSIYHKIKTKIETEGLEIIISPRNLENWARLAQHEGYVKASEKTIIPIAKNDRALEAAIKGIVFIYKWA